MQRNECNPGTEVIIRGIITKDKGTTFFPIRVEFKDRSSRVFDPGILEPVTPKYDPKREFRKGDIVRFVGRGRKNYVLSPDDGEECTVIENERDGHVLVMWKEITATCNFFDLELVKTIEEIEKEQPYYIREDDAFFDIRKKGDSPWYASFRHSCNAFSRASAKEAAEACCAELNRKHRESLNA